MMVSFEIVVPSVSRLSISPVTDWLSPPMVMDPPWPFE